METAKTPRDWQKMRNCPSIYRLTDKQGVERLFVFAKSRQWAIVTAKTEVAHGRR